MSPSPVVRSSLEMTVHAPMETRTALTMSKKTCTDAR